MVKDVNPVYPSHRCVLKFKKKKCLLSKDVKLTITTVGCEWVHRTWTGKRPNGKQARLRGEIEDIILATLCTDVNSCGDYGESLIGTQTTSTPTHPAGQSDFFPRLHPFTLASLVVNNLDSATSAVKRIPSKNTRQDVALALMSQNTSLFLPETSAEHL